MSNNENVGWISKFPAHMLKQYPDGPGHFSFKSVVDGIANDLNASGSMDWEVLRLDLVNDSNHRQKTLWAVKPIDNEDEAKYYREELNKLNSLSYLTKKDFQLAKEFETALEVWKTRNGSYNRSGPTPLGGNLTERLKAIHNRAVNSAAENWFDLRAKMEDVYPQRACTGFVDTPPIWPGTTGEQLARKYSDDKVTERICDAILGLPITERLRQSLNAFGGVSLDQNGTVHFDLEASYPDIYQSKIRELSPVTARITDLDFRKWLDANSNQNLRLITDLFYPPTLQTLMQAIQPPTKEKENNMSQINIAAMVALVGLNKKDDLSEFLSADVALNDELKAALAEAEADDRKKAIKEAAQSIRALVNTANAAKTAAVENIRRIRQDEKAWLASVKKIDRAMQYAAETSNYIPLMLATSAFPSHELHKFLQENPEAITAVPDEWKSAKELANRPDPDQVVAQAAQA